MSREYKISENQKRKNEQIVAGFLAGNQAIVYDCYESIYPMIYKYITNNSGNEHDAKTITAECLEAFYECCRKPNFELTCKFSSFIYSICRNLWLKKLNIRKRYVPLIGINADGETNTEHLASYVPPLTEESYEEVMFLNDLEKLILHYALSVSAKCEEIIRLKFLEDRSHEEVVELLGITLTSSRKRLYDCNKKIANAILNSQHYQELKEHYPFFERFVEKYLQKK